MDGPLPAVEVDHTRESPPAYGAERDFVAREHDAVFLGTVVALGLVQRSLEGADLARVLVAPEELRFEDELFLEELVHLIFRTVGLANLSPLRLVFPGGLF